MRISDWSSDVCSSDLDPILRVAIEIGVVRILRFLPSLHECFAQPVDGPKIAEMKLAITAVVRVGSESLVRLHRLEQRKDIIEGPDWVGRLSPGVIVLAMTTDIDHCIDRA